MLRYIRAFVRTVYLLMSGQQPRVVHPKLWAWIDEGKVRIDAVFTVAEAVGWSQSVRKTAMLKVEGRDTSIELILGGIRYHLYEDYPFLLRDYTQHSVTAIYANNMNDQFLVNRLCDFEVIQAYPRLHQVITQLKTHLDNIPPSTEV